MEHFNNFEQKVADLKNFNYGNEFLSGLNSWSAVFGHLFTNITCVLTSRSSLERSILGISHIESYYRWAWQVHSSLDTDRTALKECRDKYTVINVIGHYYHLHRRHRHCRRRCRQLHQHLHRHETCHHHHLDHHHQHSHLHQHHHPPDHHHHYRHHHHC